MRKQKAHFLLRYTWVCMRYKLLNHFYFSMQIMQKICVTMIMLRYIISVAAFIIRRLIIYLSKLLSHHFSVIHEFILYLFYQTAD